MGGILRQYSWVIDLVAILFCSYFLADIVGLYIGRSLEVKRLIGVFKPSGPEAGLMGAVEEGEYKIIVDRNIFDATEQTAKDVSSAGDGGIVEEEAVLTGEAVPTSLNLTVLGVLVVGDGTDPRSSATIAGGGGGDVGGDKGRKGGGGEAKVYAVGDEESFAPATKLVRIQPDRIEFIHNGRLEFAEVAREFGTDIFGPPQREPIASLDKGPAEEREPLVKKEGGDRFAVDKREIDDALQNLDRLYTEIRAVPNFAGGKVSGMKILSVKGGSIFAKLGLRRGDVLQRINGMELDVKRGFEIFNTLKDESNITLDVVRQGQPTTLEYEIR